jgi:hypothetical protein
MPAAGSGALTAEVVIPIGKAPIATVALPIAFTSDGVTVKEKLLEGNTVVGLGVAHNASAVGLVAG